MKHNMAELDCFFISYDEPNAEEHWSDLLKKVPWAKRVHGIKGFDSAHKECANQSETDYFITVDGDSIIQEKFMNLEIDYNNNPEFKDSVLSWNAKNTTNGLSYGNGGLKVWPKSEALNMNTHENSKDDKSSIEFCWGIPYIQMHNVYSWVRINGSSFQSFRAGFREGVKMCLHEGKKIEKNNLKESIWTENLKRLCIWASVGKDIKNGLWSIYGTRLGTYMTFLDDTFNIENVRDYDWFDHFWKSKIEKYNEKTLEDEIKKIGIILKNDLNLPICDLSKEASEFFKFTYTDPREMSPFTKESDIIKILYGS